MIVWWDIKAGGHAAAHSHPHEQLVWMVTGKMDFRIGNERRVMGPGDVAVVPGGVEHEGFFPEDTLVMDIFAPPRQDFLDGGPPPYMVPKPIGMAANEELRARPTMMAPSVAND